MATFVAPIARISLSYSAFNLTYHFNDFVLVTTLAFDSRKMESLSSYV